MKVPFSGGCACGLIRYTCTAAPLAMVNCYCRDCQRASGGACSPSVVPKTAKEPTPEDRARIAGKHG